MLENLDKIPWEDLQHAYGKATDVPALIRGLASKDAETRSTARWALYGNIYHQGSVYEAAVPAVPFFLELLAAPGVEDKDEILIYLSHLAAGLSYLDAHQHLSAYDDKRETPEFQEELWREVRVVRAVRSAVREGAELYAAFLQDTSTRTRAAAARVLAWFSEDWERSVGWLRSRLDSGEPEEMVRVAFFQVIGELGARDPSTLAWLQEAMESSAPFPSRVAAALGVAQGASGRVPEIVPELLLQGVVDPGEARGIFRDLPWDEMDVQMQCCTALAIVRADPDRAVPALCPALEEATPLLGWTVLRTLLSLAFDCDVMHARTVEELSPVQRDALQAVARSQTLWQGFGEGNTSVDLASILRGFGLPEKQERLQAFLDGRRAHLA